MSENALLILLALAALLVVRALFKTIGCVVKTALVLILAYAVYYFLV